MSNIRTTYIHGQQQEKRVHCRRREEWAGHEDEREGGTYHKGKLAMCSSHEFQSRQLLRSRMALSLVCFFLTFLSFQRRVHFANKVPHALNSTSRTTISWLTTTLRQDFLSGHGVFFFLPLHVSLFNCPPHSVTCCYSHLPVGRRTQE